ncbi:MAG: hypothetical protein Q8L66_16525 [Caulobacter sp.]|nr:hypothetical protein [Caulobacter sp.]
MMFSATDAAFSGFRAGREHFRAMLIWIPLTAVASAGTIALMIQMAGPELMALQAMNGQVNPDPDVVMQMLKPLGLIYLAFIPLTLIYYVVIYAAVNRVIQRPGDSAFGYLRLGGDELRQLAVMIGLALVMLFVYLIGAVGVVLIAVAVGAVNKGLATLAGILATLALVAGLVFISVRLSLASAQTFDTGKINLFGSWRLTRGRVWPMLGAYILTLILTVVVYSALFAIVALAVVLVGGGFTALGGIMQPDMSSLAGVFTPGYLIYLAGMSIAAPFLTLIMYSPAPTIYRMLTAGEA